MKKRRNRICRRIAVALTVALLVGQSHAFVLAEEGVGDTPQTEISSEETETDHPDGEDGQDKCVCGTKCAEDAVNADCPVCATDYAACGGKADDAENNDTENDDTGDSDTENVETENNDLENVGQDNTNGSPEENTDEPDQCVCETACMEDAVNADCPVCAADYANCAKNAGGGVNPSVEEVISENVLENAPDEEAGIAVLADEGVEAYALGDTITHDGIRYAVTGDGEVEVSGGGSQAVTIPASFEEKGVTYRVTGIGASAFWKCSSLSSVTIPEGVTSIGDNAFNGCSGLTSVTIPEGVTSIGINAFNGCSSLSSVTIPGSVKKMTYGEFSGCSGLTSVTIQEGVTNIGGHTFLGCSSLSSVTIPESVTDIGASAFYGCSSLSSVTIPEGVTFIGLYAFEGCSSLRSVTIPKSYKLALGDTSIQHTIFKDCVNLTTVTLSETISWIPNCMFQGCTKLETLNIRIEADGAVGFSDYYGQIGQDAFNGCPDGRKVVFWNADGSKMLTGREWEQARDIYQKEDDGDTSDNYWYGWLLEEPSIEEPTTYAVTIQVNLDDILWTGHNKIFALREEGDTGVITDLAHVSNGTYSIYDITGVPADSLSSVARDTGVDVTVQDGNAKATVNYYTATFYDNDGSGTKAYGEDTPQQQQIVLSGRSVAKPADPTEPMDPDKAGWQFDGWKTADGGSVPYDFNAHIVGKTDIYASWRSADAPVPAYVITALAEEGGSISPSGAVQVNRGDSAIFVITPDAGYRIKSVMVDGVDRTATLVDTPGGGKSYTFTNVTQYHSIRVEFEQDGGDNPNPNPDPGGGGDNPTPGGDNPGGGSGGSGGGGTGDNSNPGDGGGNNGGDSTNPGGGNTVNPGNGNNAGNTQTAAGTETSSVQAGGNATGASAGSNAAGVATAGAAVSGVASDTSAQAAGGNGTAASGKEPKTGDTAYWEVYATLAMVAGLTYLLLYVMEESRGMSEREKEAFVAAFIRWGKKGGAFRKCCAMAAIFVLLMYYHTIGKRAGGSALRERYLGQVS